MNTAQERWRELLKEIPIYPEIKRYAIYSYSTKYSSRFTDKIIYKITVYNNPNKEFFIEELRFNGFFIYSSSPTKSKTEILKNKLFASTIMEHLL